MFRFSHIAAVLSGLAAAALLADIGGSHPKAQPRFEPPAPTSSWELKADRLPLPPLAIAAVVPAMLMPLPAPPPVQPQPVSAPVSDICTRHGGWKVVTDGGRSWHCAFPHSR